jgi:hypothetical protein
MVFPMLGLITIIGIEICNNISFTYLNEMFIINILETYIKNLSIKTFFSANQ